VLSDGEGIFKSWNSWCALRREGHFQFRGGQKYSLENHKPLLRFGIVRLNVEINLGQSQEIALPPSGEDDSDPRRQEKTVLTDRDPPRQEKTIDALASPSSFTSQLTSLTFHDR
jgi:hypothetical protein